LARFNAGGSSGGGVSPDVRLGPEQNFDPVVDASVGTVGTSQKGSNFQFPSISGTELYQITGIEWKNGPTVVGNMTGGVWMCDANPPVSANKIIAAMMREVANSGADSIQRNSFITNYHIFRAGEFINYWVAMSSGSHTVRFLTAAATNIGLSVSYAFSLDPPLQDQTAWQNTTTRLYLKLYFAEIIA